MTTRSTAPASRRARAAALALLAASGVARGAPVPLDDAALGRVTGEGVAIGVHLVLDQALLNGATTDSRITLGFVNNGTSSYAVLQNLAGVADFYSFTFDMNQRTAGDPGSDYFDIHLPETVAFDRFGIRAIAATPAPDTPITTANSYGSVILNGQMAMTGHLYLWPK